MSTVQYSNAITYIALLKLLMLGNNMLNTKLQLNELIFNCLTKVT